MFRKLKADNKLSIKRQLLVNIAFLKIFWLLVFAVSVAAEDVANQRLRLFQSGFHQLHDENFNAAFKTSAALQKQNTDDAMGCLLAAYVYQTMMWNYRTRVFETDFDSLVTRSIDQSKATLKNEKTAENFFLLGTALGYRSIYLFRCRKWLGAIKGAITARSSFNKAAKLKDNFVDPEFGITNIDYGKRKTFSRLISANNNETIKKLEYIKINASYVNINAIFSLQRIYFEEETFEKALQQNDYLHSYFPNNSMVLYNRALILEQLRRYDEAKVMWEQLIYRIHDFLIQSNGYLAECHFHLSTICNELGKLDQSKEQMLMAAKYIRQFEEKEELNGPYMSVKEIKNLINKALRSF